MGILKKISNVAEKAERGYGKMKKDTAGARRVGGKILDWAIPPVKMGGCTCKCPK